MADPQAPKLTMTDPEIAALRMAYQGAACILEYGAGGSTVLAGDLATEAVFAVESDAVWLRKLKRWFDHARPQVSVTLHHGNIGATRAWGHPAEPLKPALWGNYPLSVWDRPDFLHPDVVLIDGRFRLACMITTLVKITRPVLVLVDDYIDRPYYHRIEDLVGPPDMCGRMARFRFTPHPIPMDRLPWVIAAYASPQ